MTQNFKQRRIELWIVAVLSLGLAGFFLYIWRFRDATFALWFAIPFALLTPALAWKATRADSTFQAERDRENRFFQKHPVISGIILLVGAAGSLWTIIRALWR